MDLAAVSKAIAGGLVATAVALLARFGWKPDADTVFTALSVLVTALCAYVAGHVAVYLAPKNKTRI